MQDACEENFNGATFKFRTTGDFEKHAISLHLCCFDGSRDDARLLLNSLRDKIRVKELF